KLAFFVIVDEHEFGFEPELEDVALFFGFFHLVLQDCAWAVFPGFAFNRDITDDVRQTLLPGHDTERAGIGNDLHIWALRSLTNMTRSETGETDALGEEGIDLIGWDELGAGFSLNLGKGSEDKFDVVFFDQSFNVFDGFGLCHYDSFEGDDSGLFFVQSERTVDFGQGHWCFTL